jgi:hypothetical protein
MERSYIYRTPARRSLGAYCLATGVPCAYEGSRILNSSTPPRSRLCSSETVTTQPPRGQPSVLSRLARLSSVQHSEAASILRGTRLYAS